MIRTLFHQKDQNKDLKMMLNEVKMFKMRSCSELFCFIRFGSYLWCYITGSFQLLLFIYVLNDLIFCGAHTIYRFAGLSSAHLSQYYNPCPIYSSRCPIYSYRCPIYRSWRPIYRLNIPVIVFRQTMVKM